MRYMGEGRNRKGEKEEEGEEGEEGRGEDKGRIAAGEVNSRTQDQVENVIFILFQNLSLSLSPALAAYSPPAVRFCLYFI